MSPRLNTCYPICFSCCSFFLPQHCNTLIMSDTAFLNRQLSCQSLALSSPCLLGNFSSPNMSRGIQVANIMNVKGKVIIPSKTYEE